MSTNNELSHSIKDLEKRFGVMTVGLFIKAFREAEGSSQIEFASKLALSRGNLCDIEKGRKLISPHRAAQISKKMGVTPEILLKLSIQDSLREAKLKYTVELTAA